MQPTSFALTPFERAVVLLNAEGFTDREIADKLNITEEEVEREIGSLVEKLDLSDRMELALLFIQGNIR